MPAVDDVLHVAVYILAALAAIEAAALATVSMLLVRTRREADELRRPAEDPDWLLSGSREAVKAVWATAPGSS